MKHLKLFENYNNSDNFISDVLDELGLEYTIDQDEMGNKDVFFVKNYNGLRIMVSHPDDKFSTYELTWNDGYTNTLKQSLKDTIKDIKTGKLDYKEDELE